MQQQVHPKSGNDIYAFLGDDFYFVGWGCALMVMRKTVSCPGTEYLRAMCPLW